MTLNIIMIIAIFALAAGMVLFALCFSMMKHEMEKLQGMLISNMENLNSFMKIGTEYIKDVKVGYDDCTKLVENIIDQYDRIYESYETITNQHNQVLNSWNKINDMFSDVHKEFTTYNQQFDRMTVNEIKNSESLNRISEKLNMLIILQKQPMYGDEVNDTEMEDTVS